MTTNIFRTVKKHRMHKNFTWIPYKEKEKKHSSNIFWRRKVT